jgi:hypothetical protein
MADCPSTNQLDDDFLCIAQVRLDSEYALHSSNLLINGVRILRVMLFAVCCHPLLCMMHDDANMHGEFVGLVNGWLEVGSVLISARSLIQSLPVVSNSGTYRFE